MNLSHRELLGLPVETRSGELLGKVQGFFVDPETQTIVQYEVRNTNFLRKLFQTKTLLVAANQVISLSRERMVVEDLVLTERKRLSLAPQSPSSPSL